MDKCNKINSCNKKDLLFCLVQDRIFLDNLTSNDIEYLYKLFKNLNKDRNKSAFFCTIEHLLYR